MVRIPLRVVPLFLFLVASAGAAEANRAAALEIVVPVPPTAVRVEGRTALLYELRLTNVGDRPATLRSLVVGDGADGAVVARFEGAELARRMDPDRIAPGGRATVFMDLSFQGPDVPGSLAHTVGVAVPGGDEVTTIAAPATPVRPASSGALGPPLRGGPWVAVHSPDWPRGHRRVTFAVAGGFRIPARFAVDWVKVDEAGHTTRGDADRVADARGYGDDVLAVADGEVVAVRDDLAERERIPERAQFNPVDGAGNHVVLRLDDGRYAFYEHLRPGSVRVASGQRVARGDVLGALGFTGESTGPHLHFHLADARGLVDAEGVPFALQRFELLGHYDDIGALGRARWQPPAPGVAAMRTSEWPGTNAVVRFPG